MSNFIVSSDVAETGPLRRAGKALRKALGNTLHTARIGGDEFACLLPRYGEVEMAALKASLHIVIEMNNQLYQGPRLSLAMGSAVCEKGGRS